MINHFGRGYRNSFALSDGAVGGAGGGHPAGDLLDDACDSSSGTSGTERRDAVQTRSAAVPHQGTQ